MAIWQDSDALEPQSQANPPAERTQSLMAKVGSAARTRARACQHFRTLTGVPASHDNEMTVVQPSNKRMNRIQ